MRWIITCVAFVFSFSCFAQYQNRAWKDVNYAGDNHGYHNLDIYLPEEQKSVYPVVVYIYGSAWFANNAKGADLNTIGKALLKAGYAVVMPNHRSSRDTLFPGPIHDIKAVIRFVRANAATYHFDTTFIGVSGSSSGGNMASMIGTSGSVKTYTLGNHTIDVEGAVGPNLKFSSSVDAVVDWFGPTNMLVMDSCGGTNFTHNDANSPASIYIGGPIQTKKDLTLLASPTTYVDPTDPPFLIFHGNKDNVVPYCQSQLLHTALKDAKVKSEYILVENGGHGPGVHTEANIQRMVDFFTAEKNRKLAKK
jgi:acetyl esterase/lipase